MRADLAEYEVAVPRDLSDALAHLAQAPGHWTPLAGGTDLMVVLAAGQLRPCAMLSLWHLDDDLRGIAVTPEHVELGALTTYQDVQRDTVLQREFPMLVEAARLSGAAAIQNRGTIAGNIVNASPAADSPPALLAYAAEIELASARGRRRIPYEAYHTGYKTSCRAPDELVTRILLPRAQSIRIDAYRKVGTRKAQAIAKVGLAASVVMDGDVVASLRLGLSSVAPVPLFAARTAAAIVGRRPGDAIVDALATLADEVQPIDDVRSTRTYRRRVALRLLGDVLESLARGERPTPPL